MSLSQSVVLPIAHWKQWPQGMIDSTTTRSPSLAFQRLAASGPTRSSQPMISCPGMIGVTSQGVPARWPVYCS